MSDILIHPLCILLHEAVVLFNIELLSPLVRVRYVYRQPSKRLYMYRTPRVGAEEQKSRRAEERKSREMISFVYHYVYRCSSMGMNVYC